MGNGIAHVCALNGYKVTLIDVDQAYLDKAIATITKNCDRMLKKEKITEEGKNNLLGNITTTTDIGQASDADIAIEAVLEDAAIKQDIFKKLDEICRDDIILASNTSSISIAYLGAQTKRPEKVIGMHFMNPVPMMKLVEIVNSIATSGETTDAVNEFAKKLGKTPVTVNDFPGFVANTAAVGRGRCGWPPAPTSSSSSRASRRPQSPALPK